MLARHWRLRWDDGDGGPTTAGLCPVGRWRGVHRRLRRRRREDRRRRRRRQDWRQRRRRDLERRRLDRDRRRLRDLPGCVSSSSATAQLRLRLRPVDDERRRRRRDLASVVVCYKHKHTPGSTLHQLVDRLVPSTSRCVGIFYTLQQLYVISVCDRSRLNLSNTHLLRP